MPVIPYSRQDLNEEDVASVVDVLRSNFLTTGPSIEKFENAIRDYCGAAHAIAVSNGTAALHVTLLALGVGKGDTVWTSPISFVASANCALYVGAGVDFVDIDAVSGNIDLDTLEVKLQQAKQDNALPAVLIIVHFSGRACDMKRISQLSEEYGFKIIEDGAHSLGASYEGGDAVGSGKYSDATIFSFHPVKAIATGEGGMILTQNQELANQCRLFRAHGVTRDQGLMQNESHGPWYYEQLGLGFNYRITDIQCVLGISQMKRLDEFMQRRRDIAQRYNEKLADLPLILPKPSEHSAWHLYVIQLKDEAKLNRLELFNKLREHEIGVNVHYIPIHLQPYYKNLGFKAGDFPNSELFYKRCISIPVFPKMSDEEQDYIIDKLHEFLS